MPVLSGIPFINAVSRLNSDRGLPAIRASARATLGCAAAWLEDFRGDLPRIDVPVLVVQGSQDRVLPAETTGDRLPALIMDARRVVIEGGPHAIIWTHAGQVNQALLDFSADRHALAPTLLDHHSPERRPAARSRFPC